MTLKHLLTSLVVMAVIVGVATIDRLLPPPTAATVAPASDTDPVAGQWICSVMGDLPATSGTVTAVNAADEGRADVEVSVISAGARRTVSGNMLVPGGVLRTDVNAAVKVSWADEPAAVFREWWFEGGDLPAGIVSGGCMHGVADQWIVPGLITSGGAEARLRITNPFRTDATVAVGFATPEGPAEPLALQNLSVTAQSTLEISVNESLPERDDLAAIVTVHTGRVVAEGMQLMRSAIGGIDGASLLAAAPQGAETWVIPWVVDAPDVRSWLWIYNPSPQAAAVELTYLTPSGGVVASGLDEVVIEPGTVRRVELDGTMPDDVDAAALVARVSGATIVVSGAVEVDAQDAARTGMAVQLGAVATSELWVIGGGETEGRDEQLHLVNPTSAGSVIDVAVRTDRGVRRPPALQGIALAAGASARVDLAPVLEGAQWWTAIITADGRGVVAARVGGAVEGPRRMVAWPGVSATAWRISGALAAASLQEGMTHRLGTELGLRPVAPLVVPAPPLIDDGDDGDAPSRPGLGVMSSPPSVPGGLGPGLPTDDDEGGEDDDDDDGSD